jgi:hypothetical protein
MAVVATTSGAERRNGGTILFAGNTAGSRVNNLSMITNVTPQKFAAINRGSNYNGVDSVFKGAPVTIGSVIVQYSTTGFCLITKTSHGLSVGDWVRVEGTDVLGYNVVHRVKAVVSSSTFQTDIRYTVDATVVGTYKPLARNFGKVVRNQYIASIIGTQIAGTADNTLLFGGAYGKLPYNVANGEYLYGVTAIDMFTGAVTYNGNRGLLNKYHNIDANNENLVSEPLPTRAVPGRLVYQSGKSTPVQTSYNARTI